MKMQAVREMRKRMSLSKALAYCEVSKRVWYYTRRPRDAPVDADTVHKVKNVAAKRPTYGTRRMAAQVARETGVPTNRKKVQRIYRKMGWIEPQMQKNDIILASKRKRFGVVA